jgi:hypothetical protein
LQQFRGAAKRRNVKASQTHFPESALCPLLKVPRSGFQAWEDRRSAARAQADIGLTALIHGIHCRSKGAYGAASIHTKLTDDHDIHIGC